MKPHNTIYTNSYNIRLLFFTRLLLYIAAFVLPIVHPSIAVSYDLSGWVLWFLIVPYEMVCAAFFSHLRLLWQAIAVLTPPLAAAIIIPGFAGHYFFGIALAAFFITYLIFNTKVPGLALAVPEQFFLALIYYRLLSFSRAAETIAHTAAQINQLVLFLIISGFLLHNIVLYMVAFRSGPRRKKEILLLAGIIPLIVVLALILPPSFVDNPIVYNLLEDKVDPRDLSGEGDDRYEDDNGDELYRQRGPAGLEGVPSDRWGDAGEGDGYDRQYAVMVVAGPRQPIYAADAYYGTFHHQQGFTLSRDNPLNELSYIRFMETWRDKAPLADSGRGALEVHFYSTRSERYIPYKPRTIEPTTYNRAFHPFSFSYRTVSQVSETGPREWKQAGPLSKSAYEQMGPYLEIPLAADKKELFKQFLHEEVPAEINENTTSYYPVIEAILKSFSTFQYHAGFDNDVSVAHLARFLTETRTGDCTEFSNTAAILGRLAGIPSRVVTGFLAARDLQTQSHLKGIHMLREALPELQKHPVRDLYLVTTSHRHSWVQFYIPEYGWVDFESTAHAIPPVGFGDPNVRNVVIPIISGAEEPPAVSPFPWYIIGRVLFVLILGIILSLYLFRYSREIYLYYVSKQNTKKGLQSLYHLLLLKTAGNGFAIKQPGITPREFALEHAEISPQLHRFADLYTELRYGGHLEQDSNNSRARYSSYGGRGYGYDERSYGGRGHGYDERSYNPKTDQLWQKLREAYKKALKECKKCGPGGFFQRCFSLKGVSYQW